MLTPIENLPPHVFGVKATDEVTADDLKQVLLPGLQQLADRTGELYYLLQLDTKVKNFTPDAWFQDMVAGLKHFTKWQKMAIVTDETFVEKFTDFFSYVAPGEAKGFTLNELEEAKTWVSLKK